MFPDLRFDDLSTKSYNLLTMALSDLNVVAKTPRDPRQAEVSTSNDLELADDTPAYFLPWHPSPPLKNVVEGKH